MLSHASFSVLNCQYSESIKHKDFILYASLYYIWIKFMQSEISVLLNQIITLIFDK